MSGPSRGVPFHRLHTVVTYAISALGLFALTRGQKVGVGGTLVLFVGFVASAFGGSSRPRAAPDLARRTTIWNGIMLTAVAMQVARFFLLGESILALAFELAGGLQIAKLFNRHTARDHQQIQALAFLHLIGASVLTTGLDYAFIFFGFVILTPWMLALTQMRAEIERHYGGAPLAEVTTEPESIEDQRTRAEAIARVLRSRRIAGPGFLLGTAALAIPLFLVTAGFFLLFPRVGMGFLSFGGEAAQQVAGFGSNVELGDFGVIRDDPTVVLRITPSDLPADPPAEQTFRLRGTSFDDYRDARWSRTEGPRRRMRGEYGGWIPLRPRALSSDVDVEYEVVLDPLGERVVFLPPGTIGLRSPPRVEAGLDRQRHFFLREGREIRYGDPDGLSLRYTAYVDESASELDDPLPDEQWARYLQLPDGQERIAAFAEELAGDGSNRERAERMERWLRDSGEIEYSLELPDTRGADPLEVFLFEAKRGHCEYFSTALAVMLRTQGIPARNVTGFVGGVYNEYGRYYAIKQGDAHSWVEAWLDDRWVTLDPTPSARGEILAETGLLAEIRAAIDAMRMRWSRDVVGYDLRDQVDGLRQFFRFLRSLRDSDGASAEPGSRRSTPSSSGGAPTWLIVVVIVVVLLVVVVWWRRRRGRRSKDRRVRRPPPSPSAREATRLYQRLEKQLAGIGFPRAPSDTPKEHAEALRQHELAGQEVIEAVTDAYLAARYGGGSMDAAARRSLERRLAEISAPGRR
ncbi:MAG: DUF3488 domain-containing protein [Deltaproteobacteria bacterium]|nr:DUF3488 domain-containing protein [Deltaproteobacteria bacterium]